MPYRRKLINTETANNAYSPERRRFLAVAGGAAALLLVGCRDDDDNKFPDIGRGNDTGGTPDMGGPGEDMPGGDDAGQDTGEGAVVELDFSNDFGVLNYAYALEQLEAAFYDAVVMAGAFTGDEARVMMDIRAHEIIHREFYEIALGDNAIGALQVDFSSIDFADRTQVLAVAQIFEDLGVAAYNGAAKYLQNADFLVIAGKIVSVEARHASVISSLIDPDANFFAGGPDIINAMALDRALTPTEVLMAATPFITTPVAAINL